MEILQIPSHTLLYQGETETSLLGFLIHLEKKHVKDVTFIACLCIYAGKIILSSMRFSCIKKGKLIFNGFIFKEYATFQNLEKVRRSSCKRTTTAAQSTQSCGKKKKKKR